VTKTLSVPTLRLAGVMATSIVVIACAPGRTGQQQRAPSPIPGDAVPFELWRGSDDGLTVRLSEAIEAVVAASSRFKPSRAKQPGTLFINLPKAAFSEHDAGRTRVRADVYLAAASDSAGMRIRVSCWEDRLEDCGREVWANAEGSAARIIEQR